MTRRGFGGVYSEVIASQLTPSVHTIASTDISRQLRMTRTSRMTSTIAPASPTTRFRSIVGWSK